jgi:hypothetical protein
MCEEGQKVMFIAMDKKVLGFVCDMTDRAASP